MRRSEAEALMTLASRDALIALLPAAMEAGKAARKNRLSGQESLFEDDEDDENEERLLKLDADIIRRFGTYVKEFKGYRPGDGLGITPEDEAHFWDYHRKMGKAGK